MKDYQFPHDTPDFIRDNYPKITREQIDALIASGAMRRYRKLKKERTYYVNEKNGAVLYYNYHKNKMEMCFYFIDPNHPREIEYQARLAKKQNKQRCPPKK